MANVTYWLQWYGGVVTGSLFNGILESVTQDGPLFTFKVKLESGYYVVQQLPIPSIDVFEYPDRVSVSMGVEVFSIARP